MTQLVNATFIRTICPQLSAQVTDDDAKIKTYIDHAQLKDVRPLLGYKFWKQIVDGVGDAGIIDALLDGGDYTYSGNTYENPGLKEVIARYAYARYALFGANTDTGFGMIVKQNQNARESSYQEKKDTYDMNRQIAYEQWTLVQDFLCRNSSDYTLWSGNQSKVYKMRVITKR